ncbi:MAG: hypothetical protein ACLUNQ_04810 [Oscillospiraceae bacterium]
MLWIWWPGFVVPACMVLGGLGWRCIRQLPYRRKEALNPEQLLYARETFCRTLWQLGLALGALIFMVMRSGAAAGYFAPGDYDRCGHSAGAFVRKTGRACGAAGYA